MSLVFNEPFSLFLCFDDKDNMLPCTKVHIPIWLLDSGCTANDTGAYEVRISLLSVLNTDGSWTLFFTYPRTHSVFVQSCNVHDFTCVHRNVTCICTSSHIYLFAVESSSCPNSLLSLLKKLYNVPLISQIYMKFFSSSLLPVVSYWNVILLSHITWVMICSITLYPWCVV